MNLSPQAITHAAYEDPEIVEGYIQKNSIHPKQTDLIKEFSKNIKGSSVLDLGCGPGQDSYIYADLGFKVTGLDYSHEMIKRAKELKQTSNQPTFVQGDMRQLSTYFDENTFDAIWAAASLLHVTPSDIPQTLQGMTYIAKNNAAVMIQLKGGTGTSLVEEDKLGKPMQREFTLWDKESFVKQTKPFGWELLDFSMREGSIFQGKPTQWLNFYFNIVK